MSPSCRLIQCLNNAVWVVWLILSPLCCYVGNPRRYVKKKRNLFSVIFHQSSTRNFDRSEDQKLRMLITCSVSQGQNDFSDVFLHQAKISKLNFFVNHLLFQVYVLFMFSFLIIFWLLHFLLFHFGLQHCIVASLYHFFMFDFVMLILYVFIHIWMLWVVIFFLGASASNHLKNVRSCCVCLWFGKLRLLFNWSQNSWSFWEQSS